jgi:hypothetical protein
VARNLAWRAGAVGTGGEFPDVGLKPDLQPFNRPSLFIFALQVGLQPGNNSFITCS